jgi:hypothetical protein
MSCRARIIVSCAAAAGAVLLAACAGAELDPFGRPYSGDDNYPAGSEVCHDPGVDVQPYFVRGNHPAIPILNAYSARNAEATVKFRVEPTGAIQVLKVDSVDKAYASHAVIAVRDWKMRPATRDGAAVAAECTFTFRTYFRGFKDEPAGQVNQ